MSEKKEAMPTKGSAMKPDPSTLSQEVGFKPVVADVKYNEAKTVVGVDLYPVTSVEHGVIPGSGETQPKANMVPQKPGTSTEKPVPEPEQER